MINFLPFARPLLAIALAAAAPLAVAQQTETTKITSTRSAEESSFRCDSSPNGECSFVLYSSACEEAAPQHGIPTLVCKYAYLDEFSLRQGETRKVKGLPEKVKYCGQVPGQRASFPDCAR